MWRPVMNITIQIYIYTLLRATTLCGHNLPVIVELMPLFRYSSQVTICALVHPGKTSLEYLQVGASAKNENVITTKEKKN